MTVVTAKPPRKRRQPPKPVAVPCAVVVTARKPGPRPYPILPKVPPDPEAEARAAAWLAKQLRPPGH